MKRIMIVALSVAMVACGGTKKSDDKKGDEQQRATSVSVASGGKQTVTTDDVSEMAVNYKEMAMSALENSDAQSFVNVMERRQAWYNELSDEDKAKVDASDEAWIEANAERMEKTYNKALTLSPHMVPTQQASERK